MPGIPQAIADLQVAARNNDEDAYWRFAEHDQRRQPNAVYAARSAGVQGRSSTSRFRLDEVRAGQRDRQAVLHRCDELRLRSAPKSHETLAIAMNRLGGKSNTGEGGEDPIRFQAAGQRRFQAIGDQAGRLGSFWRHDRIPDQRRRTADQDLAGCQAGRRWRTAGQQGRREHRPDSLQHAGRRTDQPAAAPRHLFDRRSGAADSRFEERQSERPDQRQAGQRSRCRRRSRPASPRLMPIIF